MRRDADHTPLIVCDDASGRRGKPQPSETVFFGETASVLCVPVVVRRMIADFKNKARMARD